MRLSVTNYISAHVLPIVLNLAEVNFGFSPVHFASATI